MKNGISVIGMDDVEKYLDAYGAKVKVSMVRSINDTARYGHGLIKNDIMNAVNLSSAYIGGANGGRLRVSQYAKSHKDSAVIQGRQRGTMLYRFVTSNPANGKALSVSVSRGGGTKEIKNSFAMTLRNGNMALVVRTPSVFQRLRSSSGAIKIKPRASKGMFKSASNLWILYAPSINQLMNQRVIKGKKIKARIREKLAIEFSRQVNL